MAEGKNGAVVRLLKRGLNHYGLGDLEAAIAAWEEARGLDPDNHAVRDYLETAYEEAGRKPGGAVGDDDPTPVSEPDVDLEEADPASADADTTYNAGPLEPPATPSLAELSDPKNPDTLLEAALEAYRAGRLEEAWRELERAAQRDPSRLDLRAYQEMIRNNLMEQWAREIGDQGRTLQLKLDLSELMQRDLKPDEGFFVSQIDGSLSIENLINLSSLDRFRTLEIIARFIREGIVE